MNRGLKPSLRMMARAEPGVAGVSPMNRGLKLHPDWRRNVLPLLELQEFPR